MKKVCSNCFFYEVYLIDHGDCEVYAEKHPENHTLVEADYTCEDWEPMSVNDAEQTSKD